jgi:vacuolar-type H+-ATPase subunit H
MDAIHGKVKENLLKELDARAHAEAKKILPEGDPNHAELFKKVMDPNNNDAFKKAIDRYLNGEDK